jgi:predicted signal transduction protein with EAL and GGDEF domain
MFRDYLEKSIAMARRQQNCLALLFMDLDNFKQINDTLGHQAGDRLLHEIARRLEERMRKEDHIASLDTGVDDNNMTDTVARLGGDEFLILLSDVNEPSDVAHTAERIQEVISEPFDIDGNRFFVGCSIGVSMYPNDGDEVDTLIRNADIAMYHAKDNGRNNYQFFNEHMNASAMARLAIENDLRSAISKNEFFLLYQPKIDLNSGEINSVEALIRWNHPDNGIIEPDDFIHVTESTSLILPIGEWVIREAARQAADWRKQGIKLSISINISTVQFNRQNLPEIIRNNIGLHKCDPECLEVELTETGIMDTYDSASRMLNDIRALGVKISMDDFGVGYSSFNHLRSLPIDSLKIDRSFVRDITTDHRDAEIVSAILAMAHTLNLKVIAEGVETKEQLDFLKDHNCDVAQGFLISYPLTGEEIVRFMRQYKTYDIINTDQSKQGVSVVQKLKNNS